MKDSAAASGPANSQTVADRLAAVRTDLQTGGQADGQADGRAYEQDSVRLLAVSKGQPADKVAQALAAGQRDFGENYLQEALGKMEQLAGDQRIRWHFIGRLQRNKARQVAGRFHWLHSLDRLELLAPLSTGRQGLEEPLNTCLQVNISARENRPGVHPEALAELAAATAEMPGLRLRGLMCMASPEEDAARQEFARMRDLYDSLRAQYPPMDTLSMGISGDWRLALAAGSTLVRLGTNVFGARTLPATPPRLAVQ